VGAAAAATGQSKLLPSSTLGPPGISECGSAPELSPAAISQLSCLPCPARCPQGAGANAEGGAGAAGDRAHPEGAAGGAGCGWLGG
jgi:hypothetical protein